MQVKDSTLGEYVAGINREQTDFVLKYGELEPLDLFGVGDIFDQSFGFVKDAQEWLNYSGADWEKYIELLKEHNFIREANLAGLSVISLRKSILYLVEAIEVVNKLESENLGSTPSADEVRAGVEVFKKYRSLPQMDKLAHGKLWKYEDVRRTAYGLCYTKLMLEADRAEFNEKLLKIRTKKHN